MTSRWPAMSASLASINDIGDVSVTSASLDQTLEYNGTVWVNRVPIRSTATKEPMGFEDPSQWTIEYDVSTRTVTATPTGTQRVWVQGIPFYLSTAQTATHDAVDAVYYLQMDSTGAMAFDTAFDFLNKAQVAIVKYDSTQTPVGWAQRENHGIAMDAATHRELHEQIGTYLVSGGGIAAGTYVEYAVSDSTNPALAAIVPAIPETVVSDEDLRTTLAALADGGPYTRLYKQWTSDVWIWETGADAPYFQTGNVPEFNPSSGGDSRTAITNNSYVCYYLLAVPTTDDVGSQLFRYFAVPGQQQYTAAAASAGARTTALNLALEEDPGNPNDLDLSPLPFTEYVIHAKIVVEYRTTWTNNDYRLRIVGYQKITGSRANLSGSGVIAAPTILDSNVSITTPAPVGAIDPAVETNQKLVNERYANFGYMGAWATGTAYRVGNIVRVDHKTFRCAVGHTAAASFYTDLMVGNWELLGEGGLAGYLQTTDAVTQTIMSQVVPADVACCVQLKVSSFEAATGDSKVWVLEYRLKNSTFLGVTSLGLVAERAYEDTGAALNVAIADISGSTFRVRVTGQAGKTIVWQAICQHTYF